MAQLTGARLPPLAAGSPKSLVIILHGYGANGQTMSWLAEYWRTRLPSAAFRLPDAPGFRLMGGRQWFPLNVRTGIERWRGVNRTAPLLDGYIQEELQAVGLSESDCVLAGFSQGAEMALHVGLRWKRRLAGLISYSGLLAGEESLAAEIRSRPPVLLIHGDQDTTIPVQALYFARDTLKFRGVPVEWHVLHGLGHRVDRQGAAFGARFLSALLPK
jgi:phospholipase/carboxylesterase